MPQEMKNLADVIAWLRALKDAGESETVVSLMLAGLEKDQREMVRLREESHKRGDSLALVMLDMGEAATASIFNQFKSSGAN